MNIYKDNDYHETNIIKRYISRIRHKEYTMEHNKFELKMRLARFWYYKLPSYYEVTGEEEIIERSQRLIETLKGKWHKKWSEKASLIVINQLLDFIDKGSVESDDRWTASVNYIEGDQIIVNGKKCIVGKSFPVKETK